METEKRIESGELETVEEAVRPQVLEQEAFSISKIANEKEFAEALTKIDNALKLVDKLREFCLQRSKPNDWLDTGGNPYFTDAGCNRFRAPFGMYERDVKMSTVDSNGVRKEISDRTVFEGEIEFVFFEGIIGSKLLGVEASFQGGSRPSKEDAFRSKEDMLFYIQKGKANWNGRGFRKLLGLENLTWEILDKAGIKHDQVRKIEFVTTEKGAAEDVKKLWDMLLELNDGNPAKAEDYLFNLTNSDQYKGKRKPSQLTAKQIPWITRKVQEEREKRFPEKVSQEPKETAPANGNGKVTDDSFQKSILNLRQHVDEKEWSNLLQRHHVQDVVEIAVDKRNPFLLELGKLAHKKGGK
jgi:hypothetical protein